MVSCYLNQSLLTDHQNHHHNQHHHHHYHHLITYVQSLPKNYLMNISSNCHFITTTKVLLLLLEMVWEVDGFYTEQNICHHHIIILHKTVYTRRVKLRTHGPQRAKICCWAKKFLKCEYIERYITLHKLNAINKIIHCLIQISIKKGGLNYVVLLGTTAVSQLSSKDFPIIASFYLQLAGLKHCVEAILITDNKCVSLNSDPFVLILFHERTTVVHTNMCYYTPHTFGKQTE